MKEFLAILLSLSLGTCQTPGSKTKASPEAPPKKADQWETTQLEGVEYTYFIYKPGKVPLENFWERLSKGDFSEAFTNIDLEFARQNHSSEVIEKLIDYGMVPVYVKARNTSSKNIEFEQTIELQTKDEEVSPEKADTLPSRFQEANIADNVEAFAQAVYSITVIVAVYAFFTLARLNPGKSKVSVGHSKQTTTKTYEIDYNEFLFSFDDLKQKGKSEGILFFYPFNKVQNWNELKVHVKLKEFDEFSEE